MAEAEDSTGHTPLTPEWTPAPRASHYPWQGDRPGARPSIYSLSRSLLREEEHCCRPSSAYINLFHRLYSFYCVNDLFRRETPCCCLRCQQLLVIKDGNRSSTAVNMTSVWKRSIGNGIRAIEWSRDRWRHVTLKGQTRDPNKLRAHHLENYLS